MEGEDGVQEFEMKKRVYKYWRKRKKKKKGSD